VEFRGKKGENAAKKNVQSPDESGPSPKIPLQDHKGVETPVGFPDPMARKNSQRKDHGNCSPDKPSENLKNESRNCIVIHKHLFNAKMESLGAFPAKKNVETPDNGGPMERSQKQKPGGEE